MPEFEETKETFEKEGLEPVLCSKCGENPAVLRKNGRVAHGLCRQCFGDKVRETRAKKKAEAKTAVSAPVKPKEKEREAEVSQVLIAGEEKPYTICTIT